MFRKKFNPTCWLSCLLFFGGEVWWGGGARSGALFLLPALSVRVSAGWLPPKGEFALWERPFTLKSSAVARKSLKNIIFIISRRSFGPDPSNNQDKILRTLFYDVGICLVWYGLIIRVLACRRQGKKTTAISNTGENQGPSQHINPHINGCVLNPYWLQ
jgi:hypothetical protein